MSMPTNRDDPLTFLNASTSSPVALSESESYLYETGSASGSFKNDGGFLDADEDFGFSRSDFRQSPLVGTVDYYHRHLFLCYKKPQVWPPRIEAAEFDRLPRLLAAALASRKNDIKKQMHSVWQPRAIAGVVKLTNNGHKQPNIHLFDTRLTICEGHDGTETSNGDVLIFPDMIRYRRLTHFDIDTFVEEVLVKDGEWLPGSPESLKGSFIFVCAHGTRDRRCGVCGPAVIARFKDEIELRGQQGKVFVRPCSHIGGHKYAGNVIIFGSNLHGKVTGHWYGYVMPDDVPALLDHHVHKGQFVDWLWRGQMGLSEEDQKKVHDLRVIAHGSEDTTAHTDEACNRGGCCQTNGISTCCQTPPVSSQAAVNFDLDTKFNSEKRNGIKNPISINMGNKGQPTARKTCSMPTWLETWESEDVYAALALIGAAVSVAVAYNCYRQLG